MNMTAPIIMHWLLILCVCYSSVSPAKRKYEDASDQGQHAKRQKKDHKVQLSKNMDLFECVENNDTQGLLLALQKVAEINSRHHEMGVCPIHVAAETGVIDSLQLLIDNGAKLNTLDGEKKTALHYAAEFENVECVKALLESGARVNLRDHKSLTPLHLIVRGDGWRQVEHSDQKHECVKLLIAHKATINTKNPFNHTPLHWATLCRDAKTIDLLLKNGAEWDVEDDFGHAPLGHLHQQALNRSSPAGCIKSLKVFMAFIASKIDLASFLNEQDNQGRSVLHQAIVARHPDCVELLVMFGANYNAKDIEGKTPIDLASEIGWYNIPVMPNIEQVIKEGLKRRKLLQKALIGTLDSIITMWPSNNLSEIVCEYAGLPIE